MPVDYYSPERFDAVIVLIVFVPAFLAYLLVVGIAALRPGTPRPFPRAIPGLVLYAYMLGLAAPLTAMNTVFTVACWTAQAVWLCFRARHEGYGDFQAFLIAMVAFVVDLLVVPRIFSMAGFEF